MHGWTRAVVLVDAKESGILGRNVLHSVNGVVVKPHAGGNLVTCYDGPVVHCNTRQISNFETSYCQCHPARDSSKPFRAKAQKHGIHNKKKRKGAKHATVY